MGRHGRRYTAGCVALAVITGVVLVSAPLGFGTDEFKGQQPAQRCLGLVGVVVILWSTEAIAPFVTSMLIPLLAIPSRVLCVPRHIHDAAETDTLLIPASYCNATNPAPGAPMEAEQAVAVATGAFFDPMILLFLSGFVMSEVLVRRGISERCAGALLSRAGTGPRQILGATMLACVCTSAITSNVPASVLGTSLLKPTFGRPARRAEAGVGSTWDIVSLLGVAFACNVGGMTSPIASPQNVVALIALERATQGEISLSFLDWLAVSVPFCLVSTGVIFAFLLFAHGGGLPANVVGPWSSGYVPGDDMEIALIGRSGSQEARSIDDSDDDGDDGEDDAAGGAAKPSPENLTSDSGVTTRVPSPANTDEPYAVLTKTDVWEREGETKGSPKAPEGGVSGEDVLIVVLILLTFISWIFFRHLKPYFGSIGILALMPIVLFGGFGYLSVVDFNRLSWDVLILMGGGLCLGLVVDSSGLLLVVGDAMGDLLGGESLFVVLLAFSSLVAVLANFISSTVAAVLLLPVIAEVGVSIGHPRLLVLLCALMTSGAMGLPVSSFPNANSFAQRDTYGAPILTNTHYVKAGFPVCGLILVLINSLGFGLCLALKY